MSIRWPRVLRTALAASCAVSLLLMAAAWMAFPPRMRRVDPALTTPDPRRFAATRGTKTQQKNSDSTHRCLPPPPPRWSRPALVQSLDEPALVMLIRRPQATYRAATAAMQHANPGIRANGVEAVELLEERRGHAFRSGPAGQGPVRERALDQMRTLIADPDRDVRRTVVLCFVLASETSRLPDVPSLVSALESAKGETRGHLLEVLARRTQHADLILQFAVRGVDDPVAVSTAIRGLLTEPNRAALEDTFTRGDTVCRAGIGEAFYRDQSSMPWAEDLILHGLVDSDPKVRARFAKGAIVLAPGSAQVRQALAALVDSTPCAAWALDVMDGKSDGCASALDSR